MDLLSEAIPPSPWDCAVAAPVRAERHQQRWPPAPAVDVGAVKRMLDDARRLQDLCHGDAGVRALPAERVDGPPDGHVTGAVDRGDRTGVPVAVREAEQGAGVRTTGGEYLSLPGGHLGPDGGVGQLGRVRVGRGVVTEAVTGGHDAPHGVGVPVGEAAGQEERRRYLLAGQRTQDRGQAAGVASRVERQRDRRLRGGDHLDVPAEQPARQARQGR